MQLQCDSNYVACRQPCLGATGALPATGHECSAPEDGLEEALHGINVRMKGSVLTSTLKSCPRVVKGGGVKIKIFSNLLSSPVFLVMSLKWYLRATV